jgi:hypothetical protein
LLRDEDPKQRAGGSSEFTIIAHVVNAGVKLCRLAGSGERLNGATPKCSVVDITIASKAVMMAGFREKIQKRQVTRVPSDMEIWLEVGCRVSTGEVNQRAACREYEIHWQTLEKIRSHSEPPGYQKTKPRSTISAVSQALSGHPVARSAPLACRAPTSVAFVLIPSPDARALPIAHPHQSARRNQRHLLLSCVCHDLQFLTFAFTHLQSLPVG